MTTTAVVLAAGAGTRLGALGRLYSKPTVPLAGLPLIAWVIARLRAADIPDLVVVAHPSDEQLADFLAARHPDIRVVQQPERRGIAEALTRALPLLPGGCGYLACACDSLFEPSDIVRLVTRGKQQPGAAVVAVEERDAEATARRSAVRLEGDRIVDIVEKPAPDQAASSLIAAPLYWLPPGATPHLTEVRGPGGEAYISTALGAFIRAGGTVLAVPIAQRLEVTTAADAARVDAILRQGEA